MKLTKKSRYAFRALLSLTFASKYKSNPCLHLKDIAETEEIPGKFLEHIMSSLKKGGIVRSQKGKGGGYVLARNPKEIWLGNVIRLMDGPLVSIGTAEEIKEVIREGKKDSGLYSILLDVRNAISEILDKSNLEDLYKKTVELTRVRSQYQMYYIWEKIHG